MDSSPNVLIESRANALRMFQEQFNHSANNAAN